MEIPVQTKGWLGQLILRAALILAILAAITGCGDDRSVTVPVPNTVQGIWQGTISLSSTGSEVAQTSRLRLELVQREYSFEGYLLKINPLAEGLGSSPVDTFLVTSGTISVNYVSFRVLDPQGGSAVFEGEFSGGSLSGSAWGTNYSGEWSAVFVY